MYLWDHIRHRSGFAVHSPFMYGVVRQAMMPRHIVGPHRDLYEALMAVGCNRRTATRVQNYLTHLGYSQWALNRPVEEGLVVATESCSPEEAHNLATTLNDGRSATLCILHPHGKAQKSLAEDIVARHGSMSGAKREFTLVVYGKKLPKQHIIL